MQRSVKAQPRAGSPARQQPLDFGPGLLMAETPQEGEAKGHLAADAIEVPQAKIGAGVGTAQQPALLALATAMEGDEQRLPRQPPEGCKHQLFAPSFSGIALRSPSYRLADAGPPVGELLFQ